MASARPDPLLTQHVAAMLIERVGQQIGYVTPDDEHQGRGQAIRAARRAGLERADQARRAYHRHNRTHRPETHS